jgi:hypothetical protein
LGDEIIVKVLGPIKHFIGCNNVIENDENDTIWIHLPSLLRDLKLKFKDIVGKGKAAATPGLPKTVIMHPQEGDVMIRLEKQTKF